jgi:hypothetical protein
VVEILRWREKRAYCVQGKGERKKTKWKKKKKEEEEEEEEEEIRSVRELKRAEGN